MTNCTQAEKLGFGAVLQQAVNFAWQRAVPGWNVLPGRSPLLTPNRSRARDSFSSSLVKGCDSSTTLERCVCQVLVLLFLRLPALEIPLPEVRDLCSPPLRLLPRSAKG